MEDNITGACHYVLGSDGYVCQQPDGMWSLSLSVRENEPELAFLHSNKPTKENIEKLRSLVGKIAKPFADKLLKDDEICATFFECNKFNGSIVKCSTLAPMNWIALLGDAAHAVAPFTGEGINSALESASILAKCIIVSLALNDSGSSKDGESSKSLEPCVQYDVLRRKDAHAAFEIAMRNKGIVSGSGAQKCANTFSTIILSIGKSVGCISTTMQDHMLGLKAKGVAPWRYPEKFEHRRKVHEDQRTKECIDRRGLVDPIVVMGTSPFGDYLASATASFELLLWSARDGTHRVILGNCRRPEKKYRVKRKGLSSSTNQLKSVPTSLAWEDGSTRIVISDSDGILSFFDLGDNQDESKKHLFDEQSHRNPSLASSTRVLKELTHLSIDTSEENHDFTSFASGTTSAPSTAIHIHKENDMSGRFLPSLHPINIHFTYDLDLQGYGEGGFVTCLAADRKTKCLLAATNCGNILTLNWHGEILGSFSLLPSIRKSIPINFKDKADFDSSLNGIVKRLEVLPSVHPNPQLSLWHIHLSSKKILLGSGSLSVLNRSNDYNQKSSKYQNQDWNEKDDRDQKQERERGSARSESRKSFISDLAKDTSFSCELLGNSRLMTSEAPDEYKDTQEEEEEEAGREGNWENNDHTTTVNSTVSAEGNARKSKRGIIPEISTSVHILLEPFVRMKSDCPLALKRIQYSRRTFYAAVPDNAQITVFCIKLSTSDWRPSALAPFIQASRLYVIDPSLTLGFGPAITGQIRHLEWSPDAIALSLAVGFQDRGVMVWSRGGCRTLCTIPESARDEVNSSPEEQNNHGIEKTVVSTEKKDTIESSKVHNEFSGRKKMRNASSHRQRRDDDHLIRRRNLVETAGRGINALCWMNKGYSLVLATRSAPPIPKPKPQRDGSREPSHHSTKYYKQQQSYEKVSTLVQLNIIKSSTHASLYSRPGPSSSLLFHSHDRVFSFPPPIINLPSSQMKDLIVTNPNSQNSNNILTRRPGLSSSWRACLLPSLAVSFHWPIQHACLSPSNKRLAVVAYPSESRRCHKFSKNRFGNIYVGGRMALSRKMGGTQQEGMKSATTSVLSSAEEYEIRRQSEKRDYYNPIIILSRPFTAVPTEDNHNWLRLPSASFGGDIKLTSSSQRVPGGGGAFFVQVLEWIDEDCLVVAGFANLQAKRK
eukprot:g335.t1